MAFVPSLESSQNFRHSDKFANNVGLSADILSYAYHE